MPLYDYRCATCGDFREFRRMMESGMPAACPVCGAPSERLIAAPFLAGREQDTANGSLRSDQTCVPWRPACRPGCSHLRCA
jgi:putative FmdB family regulatory protein